MAARQRAVVFAYNNVGVRCLKVLLAGGVDVALVVTHHDSAGENIWFESVSDLCAAERIACIAPPDATSPQLLARVAAARPDIMFSFYYRCMLPPALLALAPAYNMHGALLPRFRGRAPVNWALLHGATETGATLHEMTAKPDAGAIVAQSAVPILPDDTAFEVAAKVTVAAEQALWQVLPALLSGAAPRRPNELHKGSYFGRRTPEDGRIDWRQGAQQVYNLHRASAPPWPGAFTDLKGRRYIIARARLHPEPVPHLAPGLALCGQSILGVCGDGRALAIAQLTTDGQAVLPALLRRHLNEHST